MNTSVKLCGGGKGRLHLRTQRGGIAGSQRRSREGYTWKLHRIRMAVDKENHSEQEDLLLVKDDCDNETMA